MSKDKKNTDDEVYFGGHLGFGGHFKKLKTLKSKYNNSNIISVPKLVENEVLHWILGLLCQSIFFAL